MGGTPMVVHLTKRESGGHVDHQLAYNKGQVSTGARDGGGHIKFGRYGIGFLTHL